MKWRCPFCNHSAIIKDSNYHKVRANFIDIIGDAKIAFIELIECPNPGCGNFTFGVSLHTAYWTGTPNEREWNTDDKRIINKWLLIPSSEAKIFPGYVPKQIRKDYEEACLIKDLSPKASATLSRRCLQGMTRNFWGIKESRLIDEIEALKDKVESQTWDAIDSVRKVGNIGAHMEKDVNLIIDIEPNEADLLIGLIEMLIKDWYITKHEREEMQKSIIELAKKKEDQKKTKKN